MGRPKLPSEFKRVKANLTLPPKLKEMAVAGAKSVGWSLSEVVEGLLDGWLEGKKDEDENTRKVKP